MYGSTQDRASVLFDCVARFAAAAQAESYHTAKAALPKLEFARDYAGTDAERQFYAAALALLRAR